MAQLDVQPKKNSPWWIWLLLGIFLLAILFYFVNDRNDEMDTTDMTDNTEVAAPAVVANGDENWADLDRNASEVDYDEMSGSAVSVRGNEDYAIYSVEEEILFDTNKSTIRSTATGDLEKIGASAKKRYEGGQVRVFGYTDARGSENYNEQLAQERAESVKAWLIDKNYVNADRITVNAVGEANPVASNTTAAGRQQNRRVEIVVRRK